MNPVLHQVSEARNCAGDEPSNATKEGTVLETVRAGMHDSDGGVLRKASVVVCDLVQADDNVTGEPASSADVDEVGGSSSAEPHDQQYDYEHRDYEDDEY